MRRLAARPACSPTPRKKLYANDDPDSAAPWRNACSHPTATCIELRRTAWTVVAHIEFPREPSIARRRRTGKRWPSGLKILDPRGLTERLAASVYKQGEQARARPAARGSGSRFCASEGWCRIRRCVAKRGVRRRRSIDQGSRIGTRPRACSRFSPRLPKAFVAGRGTGKLGCLLSRKRQTLKAAGEFEALS